MAQNSGYSACATNVSRPERPRWCTRKVGLWSSIFVLIFLCGALGGYAIFAIPRLIHSGKQTTTPRLIQSLRPTAATTKLLQPPTAVPTTATTFRCQSTTVSPTQETLPWVEVLIEHIVVTEGKELLLNFKTSSTSYSIHKQSVGKVDTEKVCQAPISPDPNYHATLKFIIRESPPNVSLTFRSVQHTDAGSYGIRIGGKNAEFTKFVFVWRTFPVCERIRDLSPIGPFGNSTVLRQILIDLVRANFSVVYRCAYSFFAESDSVKIGSVDAELIASGNNTRYFLVTGDKMEIWIKFGPTIIWRWTTSRATETTSRATETTSRATETTSRATETTSQATETTSQATETTSQATD